jgi:uncharacterized protein YecE (DUF72 family)
MAKVRIGTSGWNYQHWANGVFYPAGLKPAQWLEYFTRHFDTVELNNSFYRLPGEDAFKRWRTTAPEGFVFAVKASRFITHIKRLKDPTEPLDLFFSRSKHLEDRLGPVLFQLPPQMKLEVSRLDGFLNALKSHGTERNLRTVLEVRDRSWLVAPVFELLQRYRTALCFADWRGLHIAEPITANFVYVRRHNGAGKDGNYTRKQLDHDAARIREWLSGGLDAYIYFNNDYRGHAIRNAKYLQGALQN